MTQRGLPSSYQTGQGGVSALTLTSIMQRLAVVEANIASMDTGLDLLDRQLKTRTFDTEGVPQRVQMFPAAITGFRITAATGTPNPMAYKAEYAWDEVSPVAGSRGTWEAGGSGRTSTIDADPFAWPAFNGIESGNQAGGRWAFVDPNGESYPNPNDAAAQPGDGFYWQPIRGSLASGGSFAPGDVGASQTWSISVAPVVPMFMSRFFDVDGNMNTLPMVWFAAVNAHDGKCLTPP